ncbi:MAG: head GIN domain-containing protein [Parasphingorhabdus sp.]|uniref:head GIN domain-containing protein n=1 Tax=Parasphingorhabdus sp. TaxID=2709688 RepID=UPI0030011906
MKKLLYIIPFLALAACEGSIASAVDNVGKSSFPDGIEIGSTNTNPGEFEGLTLAGPDNIIFTTGQEYTIRAEGDADVLEQLRYKNSNGQLKIGRENEGKIWSGSSGSAIIYVSAPSLKNAKLAGSGNMTVERMDSEAASLSVTGSGNMTISEVATASLSAKIAGSGDLKMAGTAKQATISLAGSGNVSSKELSAATAAIKIAGSGDVVLSSDGTVDAKIVGSGDIRIHGDARCKTKIVGSGNVTCSQ